MHTAVRYVIAPTAGAACYFFAPRIDASYPPANLGAFFTTCATVLATFFIALALLSVVSPIENLHIRQIIGGITFFYLGLGIIAATSGTITTWHSWVYPYFVAVATGGGVGTVLEITSIGIVNLRTQRDEIHASLAQLLGRPVGDDSRSGSADELTKFANLLDRGAITTEEYESQKARLLT